MNEKLLNALDDQAGNRMFACDDDKTGIVSRIEIAAGLLDSIGFDAVASELRVAKGKLLSWLVDDYKR